MKRKRESSIYDDDRVAACPYHCMKRKRESSIYDDRVAACPYHCICSPTADNLNESKDLVESVGEAFGQLCLSKKSIGEEKYNWEETKCPICLEAPHNAVLLVCSNSTKGCRPYVCKTSKLQSNCLDQFLKSGASKPMLLCPLCRGPVNEWNGVEPAQRELMNSMPRICSIETCEFSGTYEELEKHASTQHPSVQSSVADTVRQQRMLSLQRERDLQDIRAMDSDRDLAPMVVEVRNRRMLTVHQRIEEELLNRSALVSSSSGVIGQAPNRDYASLMEVLNMSNAFVWSNRSNAFVRRSSGVIGQARNREARNRDYASLMEVLNMSNAFVWSNRSNAFVRRSSGVIGEARNREARNRDYASLMEVLNMSNAFVWSNRSNAFVRSDRASA